jgi:hypothetical protein
MPYNREPYGIGPLKKKPICCYFRVETLKAEVKGTVTPSCGLPIRKGNNTQESHRPSHQEVVTTSDFTAI